MRSAALKAPGCVCGAALAIAGGFGLPGCADLRRATSLPPVNAESPVADAVAIGARRNFPTPGFTNVPPAPKDVPPPTAVKTAVFAMVGCRRTFERYDQAHPPLWSDTAQFAKLEAAQTDLNPADVPTAADDKASVAYAEQLRAYAAPPPALASGPAPTAAEATPPPMPAPGSKPPPAPTPSPAKAAQAKTAQAKTAQAKPAAAKPAGRPHPAAKAAAARAPALAQAQAPSPAAPPPPATEAVRAQALAIAPPALEAVSDPLLSHCR